MHAISTLVEASEEEESFETIANEISDLRVLAPN
jgi:hypothetical protein